MRTSILTAVAFLLVIAGPAAADDIKLKSGETLTNVKVKKKTDKYWTIITLEGQRRRIKASDIAEHVEKPTIGDEIDEKAKALGRRDTAGHFELAKYAMEQGAIRKGKKLLAKVIRLDKDHAEARAMLGHVKCDDGKWRYGRSLERYVERQEEEKKKAMGWVKVDGEYVDPLTAKRLKAGMVEYEGRWISKSDVSKLEQGMTWVEGRWYDKDEKEKLDGGMRKDEKGKWKSIEELDKFHRSYSNPPWELESAHFIVKSHKTHRLSTLVLHHLEGLWAPLSDLCGDEPLIASRDDKIIVNILKDQPAHAASLNEHGGDDRVSYYSSRQGGHYSSQTGQICVYYYSEEYLMQWVLHCAGNAFVAKIAGYGRCSSNIYEAVGSYAQGFAHGKYTLWDTMMSHGFVNHELESFHKLVDEFDISRPVPSEVIEAAIARLGFAVHFLVTEHPDVIKPFMRRYLAGEASHRDLLKELEAKAGGDEKITAAYNALAKDHYDHWKKPSP